MTNPRDKRLLISKVNTPPKGLQSLLGNVNQGLNPHELAHAVSPSVDLFPHWAIDKMKVNSATSSYAPGPGTGQTITVPAGELWMPISIAGSFSMLIAQEYEFTLGIIDPAASMATTIAVARTDAACRATNQLLRVGVVLPERFFVPAGWGFRQEFSWATSATPRSSTLNVQYIKVTD